MFSSFRQVVIATLGLLLVTSGSIAQSAADASLKRLSTSPRTEEQRQTTAWFTQLLRASYDRAGEKNPKWDAEMHALIAIAAETLGYQIQPQEDRLYQQIAVLRDLGCTDPLFQYWEARYRPTPTQLTPFKARSSMAVYEKLAASQHVPIMKVYAARFVSLEVHKTPKNAAFVETFYRHVEEAVADPTAPPFVVMEACQYAFERMKEYPEMFRRNYARLKAVLEKSRPGTAETLAVMGAAEVDLAWLERGNAFAYKVSETGWRGFSEHLETADKLLEQSWQIRPSAAVANEMLGVRLGHNPSRAQMEKWFQRAMKLDPGNLKACERKLWYLRPRWHGSHEEMLAFARQCVTNEQWTAEAAYAMPKAYSLIERDFAEQKDKKALYATRQAWEDLDAAYRVILAHFPQDWNSREEYFWAARRAGEWKIAHEQIEQLTYVHMEKFGGRSGFERYRNEARRKAEK